MKRNTSSPARPSLAKVVAYCDRILKTESIQDYDRANNGLQVENRGTVKKIAAAVDASLATIRLAVKSGADLLLVHHGLFWGQTHPWTGRRYEMLKLLLDHDLAVYSSHLPLDLHSRLGNNRQLCGLLGLTRLKPFFHTKGQFLGYQAEIRLTRDELARRLARATGTQPKIIPGGPSICRRVGVVTGGAGAELKLAAREGVDTFVTGEGPHWTFAQAEEERLNVLYGGHYATETFGVRALAGELSLKFRMPWVFIDYPTGL